MFVQPIAKPLTFTGSPRARNWFLATELMEEGEEVYFLVCFLHKRMNLFMQSVGEPRRVAVTFTSTTLPASLFLQLQQVLLWGHCLILLTQMQSAYGACGSSALCSCKQALLMLNITGLAPVLFTNEQELSER